MRISCGTAAWKGTSASGFRFRWLARNLRHPRAGAPGGAPTRGPRRFASDPTEQGGAFGGGAGTPEEIRPEQQNAIENRTGGEDEGAQGRRLISRRQTFCRTRRLRKAIHARERNQCFYCLRRTTSTVQCLDHVVPRVRSGCNSYRNLVSSCIECNSQKGEKAADDFLRRLYREGQLNAAELAARLRALEDLATGRLRPSLP